MGNPHVTIITDDIESAPVGELGPFIENHPAFPRRVNVGFIQPITEHEANVRVWERGAGETSSHLDRARRSEFPDPYP